MNIYINQLRISIYNKKVFGFLFYLCYDINDYIIQTILSSQPYHINNKNHCLFVQKTKKL